MRFLITAMALAFAFPAAAQQHGMTAPAEHHAQGTDEKAVLAVVDRLFAALEKRDGAGILAEVVPEGRATAAFTTSDGKRRVASESWPQFANRLKAGGSEPLTERLIKPHVHVDGDIAMIWSRYDFHIAGKFSHCGVDHFDFVRQDGRWRVLNLTWTQQKTGCPGHPAERG